MTPDEVAALLILLARLQAHVSQVEQAAGRLEAENGQLRQALAEATVTNQEGPR